MESEYTVRLLPEYMLGRYFQLAALSIYLSNKPNVLENMFSSIERGIPITRDDLIYLVELVRDLLIEKFNLRKYTPCELLNALQQDEPRVYLPNDRKRIENLIYPTHILTSCPKDRENSYAEVAVSFIEEVLSKKGYVEQKSIDKSPALFEAMIFSESKLRGQAGSPKKDKISLNIGVLGLMISYIGRIRAGDKLIEIYVVPDGSFESLQYSTLVYRLLFGGDVRRLKRLTQTMANLESLSLERALMTASTIKLIYGKQKDLEKLIKYSLPERFLTIRIIPEKRPNISGITPLTFGFVQSLRNKDLILVLERLAQETERRGAPEELSTAVAECINFVSESILTQNKDHIVECARVAIPVYLKRDLSEEARAELANLLRILPHV